MDLLMKPWAEIQKDIKRIKEEDRLAGDVKPDESIAVDELPLLELKNCTVQYLHGDDVRNVKVVEHVCAEILSSQPRNRKVSIGFDLEWPSVNDIEPDVALMQLAVRKPKLDSNEEPEYAIYLIQLSDLRLQADIPRLPQPIVDLLNNDRTQIVGVGIYDDILKLAYDFGYQLSVREHQYHMNKFLDLTKLGLWQINPTAIWGLSPLLEEIFGHRLRKERTFPRVSDWSKSPLEQEQIEYAAADALAGIIVYEQFRIKNKERLNEIEQLKENQPYIEVDKKFKKQTPELQLALMKI